MNENGSADGYGREWSANELSMCAQEERQQGEMKRSRTKRINEDGNNDNLQFSNSMQRNATQFNATTQCNATHKDECKTEGTGQRWQ